MNNNNINGTDELRANAAFFLKLFDMLKEAQQGTRETLDKQSTAITTLTSYLREGVQLAEIKKLVEDHDKEATGVLNEIDTCTEAINKKSETIEKTMSEKMDVVIGLLSNVKSRLEKVIIVVIVAFSLMALSYLFVRNNIENMIDTKTKSTITSVDNDYDAKGTDDKILKMLKEIREDMLKFHSKTDGK